MLRPRRLQRARRGREDHRRHAHPRVPAHAEHLVAGGARLVLASHLGRPKKGPAPEFSLAPVAARLSELLGKPVGFAPDCVGDSGLHPRPGPSATAASCSSRTCASTRRKRRTTPASPSGSSRASGATRLRERRLRLGPPRPRLDRRRLAPREDERGRPAHGEGAPLPGHGARGARAAVRGRARGGQGLGQDPGDREPAAPGGRAARGRRHGLHLLQGPGPRAPARAWWRKTRSPWPRAFWRRRVARSTCPWTTSWPPPSRSTPSAACCP